uniref:Secreted protein n=1 Tax=Haemonchus contortus TaxID=6289 RepID=A0A7I4Y043_HAECO
VPDCKMPHSLSFIICLIVVLLLLPTELLAAEDCYKYSKKEFTTITACDHGCEYVYKNRGKGNKRISGGCASDGNVGCRSRGNGITVCSCHGSYCNSKGYGMHDDDSRSDTDEH